MDQMNVSVFISNDNFNILHLFVYKACNIKEEYWLLQVIHG